MCFFWFSVSPFLGEKYKLRAITVLFSTDNKVLVLVLHKNIKIGSDLIWSKCFFMTFLGPLMKLQKCAEALDWEVYPYIWYMNFHDFFRWSHWWYSCAWFAWFCMTILHDFAWFSIFFGKSYIIHHFSWYTVYHLQQVL